MPIEISILSGARQGSRIQLPDSPFDAGSLSTDAVCFDPQADHGVVGHRASLWLGADGWRIRSTGSSPITVNHDAVEGIRELRSGDIIRMSADGPDFAFTLIGRMALSQESASGEPQPFGKASAVPPETSTATHNGSGVPATKMPFGPRWPAIAIGLVCFALAGLLLQSLLRRVLPLGRSATEVSRTLQLGPIEALTVDEGQTLNWRPMVLDRGIPGADLLFELGEPKPDGMEIDSETGTIRWTPTEQQGPQELKLPLVVSATGEGRSVSTTETLFIVINEVNQPPVVNSIRRQTINLLANPTLELTVQATDPDAPAQRLTYTLGSGAPEGMLLDSRTGKLTWQVTERHADQEFEVKIHVSDDAAEPLSAMTELHVSVISPDPLEFAAKQLVDSVYLVGARPVGLDSFYPLGTACAITEHMLVTNAAVATAVVKAKQVQWSIVVVQAGSISERNERAISISQTKVHRAYVEEDDAALQTFFDLGLLTVGQRLPTTCPLASEKELAEVSINQTFGCFGYTVEETALTRFDNPIPELRHLKLARVLNLDGETGPARLLELVGEIPQLAYGSLIINLEGKLLGIYALSGQLPEGDISDRELHYAPVATLAAMRLKDPDTDKHWVVPAPPPMPISEEAN